MPNRFIVEESIEDIEENYCVRLNEGKLVEDVEWFFQYCAKKNAEEERS